MVDCVSFPKLIFSASAAYAGGLRPNDRILEVNGHDARGAAHSVVVDWVVAGGSKLSLKVLSVSEIEAVRLKRIEEQLEDVDGKKTVKVDCSICCLPNSGTNRSSRHFCQWTQRS